MLYKKSAGAMQVTVYRNCCSTSSSTNTWKSGCTHCKFLDDTKIKQRGYEIVINIKQTGSTQNSEENAAISHKQVAISERLFDMNHHENKIDELLDQEITEDTVKEMQYLKKIIKTHKVEIAKLQEQKLIHYSYDEYDEDIEIIAQFGAALKIKRVEFKFARDVPPRIKRKKKISKRISATTHRTEPKISTPVFIGANIRSA